MRLSKILNKLNNKFGLYSLYRGYLSSKGVYVGRGVCFKNFPIIRNSGEMNIGDKVVIESFPDGEYCRTRVITNYKDSKINIGKNSVLRGTTIWSSQEITIGDNFLSAPYVWIVDNDAHGILPDRRSNQYAKSAPVRIGNNVWVGYHAMILKGVSIGDNSVIAAGAIVTKDVPANCVAGGVPAEVIKKVE